jgi:hypothetical protein
MNLYITIFLLFICVLIYLIFWHEVDIDNFEGFSNSYEKNIHFLSADETRDLISSNADGYFERFTQNDLRARTKQSSSSLGRYVVTLDQYIQGFNCDDFTESNKDLIDDCVAEIETIVVKDPYVDWVDSDKFHAIPWKIGLIEDDSYEYGLPHTRGDTILIPKMAVLNIKTNRKDFINTLIHEKLHVYQKLYPADFQKYLDHHGFVKYARYGNGLSQSDIAANPDTDEYVYAKKSGLKRIVHCGKYNFSTGKTGVKSIVYQPVNDAKYDHPRELAVYNLLENLLV